MDLEQRKKDGIEELARTATQGKWNDKEIDMQIFMNERSCEDLDLSIEEVTARRKAFNRNPKPINPSHECELDEEYLIVKKKVELVKLDRSIEDLKAAKEVMLEKQSFLKSDEMKNIVNANKLSSKKEEKKQERAKQ